MKNTFNQYEFFYGYNHPLSQWYYADFTINEICFNCCEQWMMYSKARLFQDYTKAEEILKEPKANLQRKLGRQVRYYKQDMWEKQREKIVFEGNLAKFSQNVLLKDYLLSTGNKNLAEASPTDLIWGIGLPINDKRIHDRKNWIGINLLGEILMKVRDKLAIINKNQN